MRAALIIAVGLVSALLSSASSAVAQTPGYALRFDGTTDLVRLNTTASIMAATWPTTKTVSLWVNPTGTSACTGPDPASCDAIFGDRPRTWGISRGVVNGEDRIWIWNYDGTVDRVGIEYTTGVWTQVALVHANGVLSAYKDGAFVGSIVSGATQEGGGPTLHFGGIINNASRNWTFEGEIDDVQIWNVARSASEVAESIGGPLTGTEPGLAAYYRMTDGSGISLSDDTGHGWTGTLLDGAGGVAGNGPIAWVDSGAFGIGPIIPNSPPVADPQDVATAEDIPVPVTLSGTDEDGDPLTFRVTVSPAHGALSGTASSLSYTPAANFFGTDSFAFVVNDGRADSAPATVSLTVTALNDPPVAGNDTAVTAIDTPVTVSVLTNDFDVDGGLFAISSLTQPLHGAASNEITQVLYTPAAGFIGTDTFTYTIDDGQGGVATASVTVTVTGGGADPGLALRFDGTSDFVTLAKTANLLATGWETTKTVSLWVKPEGTPYCNFASAASCDSIFGDRPRWWGISRGVASGVDRIWVWNYDGSLDAIGIPYTAGEWIHIALVHGSGILSAYKNGVLVGSTLSGPTRQPTTGALPTLQIGGIINNATANWTFQGEIDELQLWNSARTTEQIRQDMSSPLSGAELGLAAYYGMSDGSGKQLTDDSGHGWTGTFWDGGSQVPADGFIMWVPSGAFSVVPPQ